MSRTVLCVMLLLLGARSLCAQDRGVLTGTVRESTSGLAVPGAVVSLLDSARTVLQRTTSGARGEYRLVLSPSATRVQVRRIGFRPSEHVLALDNGGSRVLDLPAERLPSMITGLIVRAQGSCPTRDDTPIAFGLWEQARSALLASVVARQSPPATMRRYRFERTIEGELVRGMTVATDTSAQSRASFEAVLTAEAFVRNGFAVDSPTERTFYGPDADVLLSDEFLNGYCMRLADRDPKHPERVGVRFTPARTQRNRQEIDGTLWIDTVARSLTHIAYRYIMNDPQLNAARPGGEVVFADMPNGAVLIDRWTMRLAGYKSETVAGEVRGNNLRESMSSKLQFVRVIGETGGALAEAKWRDGSSWRGSFGALTLQVEANSGRVVSGRVIGLSRSPYRAKTDSTGTAHFRELVAGPYEAFLEDERLRPIKLDLAVPVARSVVLGETAAVRMTFPTPESFVTAHCREDKRWKPGDIPMLLIRVMTWLGQPVENARIDMAWEATRDAAASAPTRLYTTGKDGLATLCMARELSGKPFKLTVRGADGLLVEQVLSLADTLTIVPLVLRD